MITPLREMYVNNEAVIIMNYCCYRECSKEELTFCYKGANQIVRTLVSKKITASPLFKASVQLFLTVMDKHEDPDFVKKQMDELSGQILEWMGQTHGTNLLPSEIMNELKVK